MTTVCHYQPVVVDSSPPVVFTEGVSLSAGTLQVALAAIDEESFVRVVFLGIGRTAYDVSLLTWQTYCVLEFQQADGLCAVSNEQYATYKDVKEINIENIGIELDQPLFVRLSAANNANKRTNVADSTMIIHDDTPPIAGSVFAGGHKNHHVTWFGGRLIPIMWFGFDDPDSGLSKVRK